MNKKEVIGIFLFICILFISQLANSEGQKNARDYTTIRTPNPSSAYAIKLGYNVEIRNGEKGDYGVVVFPDGTECNAWDFYRGKAEKKWSYCELNGGKIENRIENMGTRTAEYAVCVFPDGSESLEKDYIDGKIGPGVYEHVSMNPAKCIRVKSDLPPPK